MKTLEAENLSGKNHAAPHINSPLKFLTASSIIGDKVFSLAEEKIGSINDIMIDVREGKIEYVVIELGGFLGIGEKFFAIPYSFLKVDAKNQTFIFLGDTEKLKHAPGPKRTATNSTVHLPTGEDSWGLTPALTIREVDPLEKSFCNTFFKTKTT